MMKAINALRMRRHQCRMTELGQELLELMQEDGWTEDEYTLTHKASGVRVWVGSGLVYFRLHAVSGLPHSSEAYDKALNRHDRIVLWDKAEAMKRGKEAKPPAEALNMIRMYKIKEQGSLSSQQANINQPQGESS